MPPTSSSPIESAPHSVLPKPENNTNYLTTQFDVPYAEEVNLESGQHDVALFSISRYKNRMTVGMEAATMYLLVSSGEKRARQHLKNAFFIELPWKGRVNRQDKPRLTVANKHFPPVMSTILLYIRIG